MDPTHYGELGVPHDADGATVRAAYRALMMRHHPDTNRSPEATERAVRINAAWACLRDPDQRRAYDDALSGLSVARPHRPMRRRPPPPSWTVPAAVSPLTIGVFICSALAAIVPTAALLALAHGWDGSFRHTVRVAVRAPGPVNAEPARPVPRTVHLQRPGDERRAHPVG